MSSVEKLLVQQLESGLPLNLAALGGEEALLADAAALAASPLFDEVLTVLCQDWSQITKQTDVESLILSNLIASEPLTLANCLDILFECRAVLERIATPLSDILVARIKNRRNGLESLVATRALEGLLRLALENLTTKYALLGALTSLQSNETELFANHAARIVSIAYEQWKENELLEALQRIITIPGVTAEANFSLGLAMLSQAFEQVNQTAIYNRLEIANKYFREAILYSEERDDAVAYGAAIEVLLCLNDNAQQAAAHRAFERLQRAVTIRQGWLYNTHLPNWLTRLVTSEVEWTRLISKIQTAMGNLAKPAWLNAVNVLHQLFEVYKISRASCINVNTRGLELLLQPHIETTFLHSQAHLSVLNDWLQENQNSTEWHDTAKLLRERIKILAERTHSSSTSHPKGGRFPLLVATLGIDALAGIKVEHCEQLEGLLRTGALSKNNLSIVGERIFRTVTAQLSNCSDYTGEVKATFDDLLLRTINFLANRMDLGKGNAAPGQMYLFAWEPGDDAPHEKELQLDYWNYLVSSYGSQIRIEVSDIASGRVDAVLFYARHHFIAEMKRELKDASPSSLKKYLGQIAIYEATNVRLGLLLVLDLTNKAKGPNHIEQNVWVEKHEVGSFADARYVVVFRVPGNRIYPSSTIT